MRPNRITPEGWLLGKEIARICDIEIARRGADERCGTCAFRAGDHLANGSPETLMSAVKSAAERTPFWCHERDRPCAGWLAMRADAGAEVEVPWEHCEPADPPTPPERGVGSGDAIQGRDAVTGQHGERGLTP